MTFEAMNGCERRTVPVCQMCEEAPPVFGCDDLGEYVCPECAALLSKAGEKLEGARGVQS